MVATIISIVPIFNLVSFNFEYYYLGGNLCKAIFQAFYQIRLHSSNWLVDVTEIAIQLSYTEHIYGRKSPIYLAL